ncbi:MULTISPECIES: prephenate dehydratase [Micromonospora]|jgi:prephenate dehydratase|uniref:Prephenate dehydratase n=1 Tax=Micromonospora carbonacea TaxID=47853 RepID=A0A7H8XT03_9ACTN|nr:MULTISPECIES: prephenate dehydratase [Micromonospora]MBB5829897.1 prephenate dehydratase [Micromonospora carbonacea]MDG4816194.1 prephenate dehydratase [Micromonospora sp. WMMD956]QLD28143.1 prephenate dehydratase [Micromonospora carbonacea]WFE58725.1 prephenate dehydratase [Micromonospora sp. WMMD712]
MPGTPPTRFVYLGPEGTFAEQALRTVPAAERGTRTPARSVGEALEAVRAGEADAALVPLENSIGGAVGVTLDELAEGDPLVITREVILPVEFVLGARQGTSPEEIRSVAAHPQASTQCRGWLRTHLPDAVVVDVLSNGAAAAGAATGEFDAAICAPIGAARHRLAVLADKIADHPDAVTRFALLSRPGPPSPPTGDDLTSLAVYIAHDRVGALLSVLMELAVRGVNLTRIESRPTGEALGRYVFFLDCTGHVAEPRLGEALQGLRRVCAQVRFLGSYPRHRWAQPAGDRPVPAPAGLSDADYADASAWLARLRAGELS